jgi:immunity protein Imm1 of predicted polymorphic toxin system
MEVDDSDGGFTLEVTRFAPALATDALPVAALADFDAAIQRYDGEGEVVFGLVGDEGAWGAFYLFVSGDRAWVHLTAGPCCTARSRVAPEPAEPLVFRLDNGEQRAVPADQTVSREQGLRALRHWLCTGQPWPGLEWVRA